MKWQNFYDINFVNLNYKVRRVGLAAGGCGIARAGDFDTGGRGGAVSGSGGDRTPNAGRAVCPTSLRSGRCNANIGHASIAPPQLQPRRLRVVVLAGRVAAVGGVAKPSTTSSDYLIDVWTTEKGCPTVR